jgi:Methyltransferase domain
VCAPEQLLSHDGCVVFSIGSNGEASFESAILDEFPHCQMHTFDPTLTPQRAAKVRPLLLS